MYLINVWQEIFEVFSKGSLFTQTFGGTVGLISIVLLILRPILTVYNNYRSQKEYMPTNQLIKETRDIAKEKPPPTSEYIEFCDWLVEFQYLAGSKSKQVLEFCSIEYNINEKCIVFISNAQLTQEHYKIIITIFSLSQATLGIILCKLSGSEKNEILETFKAIKEKFLERPILDINAIHWFQNDLFSPVELIPFMGFGNDWIFKRLLFKDKQGDIIDPFKLQ